MAIVATIGNKQIASFRRFLYLLALPLLLITASCSEFRSVTPFYESENQTEKLDFLEGTWRDSSNNVAKVKAYKEGYLCALKLHKERADLQIAVFKVNGSIFADITLADVGQQTRIRKAGLFNFDDYSLQDLYTTQIHTLFKIDLLPDGKSIKLIPATIAPTMVALDKNTVPEDTAAIRQIMGAISTLPHADTKSGTVYFGTAAQYQNVIAQYHDKGMFSKGALHWIKVKNAAKK